MTKREIIRTLILSPLYLKLTLKERARLIRMLTAAGSSCQAF